MTSGRLVTISNCLSDMGTLKKVDLVKSQKMSKNFLSPNFWTRSTGIWRRSQLVCALCQEHGDSPGLFPGTACIWSWEWGYDTGRGYRCESRQFGRNGSREVLSTGKTPLSWAGRKSGRLLGLFGLLGVLTVVSGWSFGKGIWVAARPRRSRVSGKQSNVSSPREAVGPENLVGLV